MYFKNVIGQQDSKQHLIQLVNSGRLPHALLICGNEGTGGLPIAMALAQYMMCENKTENDACGQCANCNKMQKMQHPDVHFSFPVIKPEKSPSTYTPVSNDFIKQFRSFVLEKNYGITQEWLESINAENKQGNITAKECRDIINKLQLRSYEGGNKILIMWRPEFMGLIGNILLKLIEEPPANTIMIFVAENYENILATIQSRTQLVQLKPLSDEVIYEHLLSKDIDENVAMQVARMAEGNYHKAVELLLNTNTENFDWLKDWLNALFRNNGIEILSWVTKIATKNRDTQKQFIAYFIALLEHLVRIKHIDPSKLLLQNHEKNMIEVLIKKNVTEYKAEIIVGFLNDAIYHIERNANGKYIFHGLSIMIKDEFLRK